MSNQENEKNQQLVKSVLHQASGTFSSRILGLVRDVLFGALFSRTVTDAWLVAFRLPNMFRRLFGEGALSVSFIPVFIDILTQQKRGEAEESDAFKMASGVFTVLSLILISITILGMIFSEKIVYLVAGEEAFMSVPGKFDLAVQMTQVMFVFCAFVCFYAYYSAILNAFKKFSLPAFAPVLFNISMIVSTLLPQYLNVSVMALAWGVVVGGFLQMAILIPSLIKMGYFPVFTARIGSPAIRQVFKNMLPGLAGMGIIQITIIVNTRFAASLEEGANSWIFWADRLLELPLSLFAVSLGTALLPTLSEFYSQNKKDEMLLTSQKFLKAIFYVAVPCSVGIYILSEPIVEILFKRGKFSDYDVKMTAMVLSIYSIAVLAYAGVRVIVSSFYAVKNTTYPAVISIICLGIHILVAPFLMKESGVSGLVTSTVISASLNFLFLTIGYRFLIGPFYLFDFLQAIFKFSFASLIMGGVAYTYFLIVDLESHFLIKTLTLFAMIGLSTVVYFLLTKWIGCPEFELVFGNLRKKISKKVS